MRRRLLFAFVFAFAFAFAFALASSVVAACGTFSAGGPGAVAADGGDEASTEREGGGLEASADVLTTDRATADAASAACTTFDKTLGSFPGWQSDIQEQGMLTTITFDGRPSIEATIAASAQHAALVRDLVVPPGGRFTITAICTRALRRRASSDGPRTSFRSRAPSRN